ncbi:MAG: transcriptional regulator [Betaproteobacteria bacterium RIFCSPLOWO2_02_FULL_67_26]|nr:MAG: transcriptional regulator [Betaproteobacteria bacterium RIFCSPLOWO2_02_FULL_67_26]
MGIKIKPPKERPQPGGVANTLFTKAQQRVLGVLFGNPGRSFFANEVIALAGTGTGAVQRELTRLASSGLVTVKRVGKQKHYQANEASPVFEDLRGLVVKTSGIADVLRVALAPLADRIGAAFVYGSVAKKEDTASSDIDLMVLSDSLTYGEVFAVLEEGAARLGRRVNPTVYSRQEFNRRIRQGNSFVTRVLAQPKIWLLGNENALGA